MLRRKLSKKPSAVKADNKLPQPSDNDGFTQHVHEAKGDFQTERLNSKKRKKSKFDDARQARLEEEVLGVADDVLETLPLLVTPKEQKSKAKKNVEEDESRKWEDSDDDKEEALQYDRVNPAWAKQYDDEKSEDSDDEILKAHSHHALTNSVTLPSSSLQFKRVADANKEDPCAAPLRSIEFHRTATVLLTGGQDNTIRLFAVDGNKNTKIHSMYLQKTPILCCHFNRGGSEIVIGSKYKSFYVYDMEGNRGVTLRPKIKGLEVSAINKFHISPDGRFIAVLGKNGYVHLFSQTSKELIDSLKMNGEVKSICFSSDGNNLYTFGSDGEVYIWDMNTRDCVHHFSDDGCINGTSVSVSPDNEYFACGSSSGIVNVYERDSVMLSRNPRPVKLIKNLTTPCTDSLFSPQSEMLAIRTRHMERGIKLVHFPSMTVFPNFPDQFDAHIGSVTCMDFSPSSGYMALGNHKGRCLLYRLQHYSKY